MGDVSDSDPVTTSVAMDSTDPIANERKHAGHLLDRPQRCDSHSGSLAFEGVGHRLHSSISRPPRPSACSAISRHCSLLAGACLRASLLQAHPDGSTRSTVDGGARRGGRTPSSIAWQPLGSPSRTSPTDRMPRSGPRRLSRADGRPPAVDARGLSAAERPTSSPSSVRQPSEAGRPLHAARTRPSTA